MLDRVILNSLASGLRVLVRAWEQSRPKTGGQDRLNFSYYAVPPDGLRGFLREHPDAVLAGDFLDAMAGSRYAADRPRVGGLLTAMAARNPGCEVCVVVHK